MLSSMASKVAQRGLINAMDIPETGKAPQEVSELTAQVLSLLAFLVPKYKYSSVSSVYLRS
jgi:hypothetical protein